MAPNHTQSCNAHNYCAWQTQYNVAAPPFPGIKQCITPYITMALTQEIFLFLSSQLGYVRNRLLDGINHAPMHPATSITMVKTMEW